MATSLSYARNRTVFLNNMPFYHQNFHHPLSCPGHKPKHCSILPISILFYLLNTGQIYFFPFPPLPFYFNSHYLTQYVDFDSSLHFLKFLFLYKMYVKQAARIPTFRGRSPIVWKAAKSVTSTIRSSIPGYHPTPWFQVAKKDMNNTLYALKNKQDQLQ